MHTGEKATDITLLDLDLEANDAAYLAVVVREQDNAQLFSIWKTVEAAGFAIAGIIFLVAGVKKAGEKLLEKAFDKLVDAGEKFVDSLSTDADQTIGAFDVRIANDNDNLTVQMGGVRDVGVVSQSNNSALLNAHGSNANYSLEVRVDIIERIIVEPPPKPKRTSHSGCFLQDVRGEHGNFELLAEHGSDIIHYSRNNSAPGFPWIAAAKLPSPTAGDGNSNVAVTLNPIATSVIQSNFGDGNLEAIVHYTPVLDFGGTDRLFFFFKIAGDLIPWHGPFPVLIKGRPIEGITGPPALIQSTFGKQGNFEMLVPQGKRLVHYFRDNDAKGLPWRLGADLPVPVAGAGGAISVAPTAVSLIQSNFNEPGNLEAVARFTPAFDPTGGGDSLHFYFLDSKSLRWNGPFPIVVAGKPITGVTGNPAFLQGTFGKKGNFEMLVPQGNRLAHYFRENDAPGFPWRFGGDLPLPRTGGGAVVAAPTAVSMIQSNFNDPGNLEVVVRLSPLFDPSGDGDSLGFYFRDSKTVKWNGPFSITAQGKPITNVTGF